MKKSNRTLIRAVQNAPALGKTLIAKGLKTMGLETIRPNDLLALRNRIGLLADYANSKSQIGQDIFVLTQLNRMRNGFFVEFGATNGVDLSNTHLLENEFGWTGILAEPAKRWHEDLKRNRTAIIDTRCVFERTRETVEFHEVDQGEYSTIRQFADGDQHAAIRLNGNTYSVATVSLEDLLAEHSAPKQINYLSIDTEGSEYSILKSFDFSQYTFDVITCEHNFTADRQRIYELLNVNGYRRIREDLSLFDDWYVRK